MFNPAFLIHQKSSLFACKYLFIVSESIFYVRYYLNIDPVFNYRLKHGYSSLPLITFQQNYLPAFHPVCQPINVIGF